MPAVQAPATILVTGASGFVAAQVVAYYLKAGFNIRGTVRSAAKGEYLQKLFGTEKFSYVIVKDIAEPGAFDEAAQGVDAIAHTASPFHFDSTNPDDYYIPAVKGTVGALETAAKTPSVKRVIITSSVVAAWEPKPDTNPPYVWTESDWNTDAAKQVEEKGGAGAGAVQIYFASKALAEKAAWDCMKANEGKIGFDLVTILPPWVFGPAIHEIPNPKLINTSVDMFRVNVLESAGASASKETLLTSPGSLTDVRDVAEAHVLATSTPAAGGERFLISSGSFNWQKILDAVNASGIKANTGFPGEPERAPIAFDSAKATRILGFKPRSLEEIAVDTAKELLGRPGAVSA